MVPGQFPAARLGAARRATGLAGPVRGPVIPGGTLAWLETMMVMAYYMYTLW